MTNSERVDVAIVGSGPGGAVVAHEASKRGLSTLLLERGPYVRASDMNADELRMIPRLYQDGGLFLTAEMDMFVLQGRCVGGSSVLANMVMMRPPGRVFEEWQSFGAPVSAETFPQHFDNIEVELDARPAPARNVSRSSAMFMAGAQRLGLLPHYMNKALGACDGCGYCNVGCTRDTKKGALSTYVRWAESAGARVIADAEVTRIVHKKGRAQALEVLQGRGQEPLRVEAKQIVVSAGAIGSSALLLRSEVRRNIGTRLSFNAGAMVLGVFSDPVDGWDGDQMTVALDGPGYVIEATHNPPMSMALTTPGWFSEHGELMRNGRRLGFAGVLVATDPVGRVVHSRSFGHEEVHFRLPAENLRTLQKGVRRAAEVLFAAGAEQVVLPCHRLTTIDHPSQCDRVFDVVRDTRQFSFGSAHPQGGNPWSEDPRVGAVDADLALHGFENLFVCDASVFPSCIGVNPIETVLAVAKHGSQRILARA